MNPEWRARAACKGMDPALFFPERGDSTTDAKAACMSCPVRGDCLTEGMHHKSGIWGGKSEHQRRRMRRVRRVA